MIAVGVVLILFGAAKRKSDSAFAALDPGPLSGSHATLQKDCAACHSYAPLSKEAHTVFLSGLHERIDLVDLLVSNDSTNGGSTHHDLGRDHAPLPSCFGNQRLRDHTFENEG